MILRPALTSELHEILRFWTTAAENDSRPADTAEALAALHRRDDQALIVALDGERIVGTVIAGWDGWRCHLYRLAVAPGRRREGIGAALIDAAEERFRALGGTRVDAMVLDGNERGHAIWAARGYRRQEDWSRWVKPLS
ncbi:GNAT family N-acetyltransferase [Actinoplanes bogorensis]|uniref:GNAT family N-acetyltransferase n=1 Tax=Paractinoplanes bogorensis TaxID=1610840 RepID=A0ABS5YWB2_9ACTN|nr:GNAT family N-acetyltransferase [Actinoplanes bogorensis]MBU2667730.1 GNAT family N-acetyltransferase [Actinoplanes bogorensis]